MDINSCVHLYPHGEHYCQLNDRDCYKYSCNSTTKMLDTSYCIGVCRPKYYYMTSAKFADSKDGIFITLHSPAAPGAFPCSDIFDNATSMVLGTSAMCTVVTNTDSRSLNQSGTTLLGSNMTVQLGPDARVRLGSVLMLSPNTGLVSSSNSSRRFGGNITVQLCDSCQRPQALLLGPTLVTQPCSADAAARQELRFDARGSRDVSRRHLDAAIWKLADVENLDNATLAALEQAISATNQLPTFRWDAVERVVWRQP